MDLDSDSDDLSYRWPDLQPDVLSAIAARLDPMIGILRLRSVCRSWRSSLSLSSSTCPSSLHFPLKLPFPLSLASQSLSSPPPSLTHLSLIRRTVYLLSPPYDHSGGFLVKVEEVAPNTFSLFEPLSDDKVPKPSSRINLLNCRVSVICNSYVLEPKLGQVLIRKFVVARGFFGEGDFVVLALTDLGRLLLWRVGDEEWTEIGANGRCFDDIISYKGKFFATADKRGRLVMIDSRLTPMDMVHSLMYGCGRCTHLLECDGDLYLVDRVSSGNDLEIGVFKLDEKCRFWDYQLNLNGSVFFVGDDVNFSISNKDYNGSVRNCIYFITNALTNLHEGNEGSHFTAVFEMEKGAIHPLRNSEQLGMLYWPPSSWFWGQWIT